MCNDIWIFLFNRAKTIRKVEIEIQHWLKLEVVPQPEVGTKHEVRVKVEVETNPEVRWKLSDRNQH